MHLKDVRPIEAAPGYQWVTHRGRVNMKGCVAALKDIGFDGWAIAARSRRRSRGAPKASAAANRDFVVDQLGLALDALIPDP